MSKFREWVDDTAWIVIPILLALWFCIWLFGYNEESYYRYQVRVTFCDSRPPRVVDHYGQRCPGIDNEEQGRYHSQALSSFDYKSANHVSHTLLNVCEVTIIDKTYLGDYTMKNVPNF